IETPDANLSRGMRQLNGVYTQSYNYRHHRVGHVFQGRYKAIHVEKESYLLELSRYIVLNPVRAHMVSSAQEWRWSSYRATVGLIGSDNWLNSEWLLAGFGATKRQAINRYKRFVAEGKAQPSPWCGLKNQVYLGGEEFISRLDALIDGDKDLSEIPSSQRRGVPKTLSQYETLAGNRADAMVLAYKSGGYTLKEIGSYFGVHYSTVSRVIRRAKCKTRPHRPCLDWSLQELYTMLLRAATDVRTFTTMMWIGGSFSIFSEKCVLAITGFAMRIV
ncbi:Homeodomain-like domain-containing protein, partial [Arenicella xantha]